MTFNTDSYMHTSKCVKFKEEGRASYLNIFKLNFFQHNKKQSTFNLAHGLDIIHREVINGLG
jgi:hypothetical protein